MYVFIFTTWFHIVLPKYVLPQSVYKKAHYHQHMALSGFKNFITCMTSGIIIYSFLICMTLITSEFEHISYVYKITCFSTFKLPVYVLFSLCNCVVCNFFINLKVNSFKTPLISPALELCNISSVCLNSGYVKS